jgi:flagellar biosynthetic protein FliR
VTPIGQETLLGVILLFCRVGGCLLAMPGFSSSRVPMQIRVFLALAITLALAPLMLQPIRDGMPVLEPVPVLVAIGSETAIGLLIGLGARIFYAALSFVGTSIAMYVGFSGMPDTFIEDGEPQPAIATLVTLTATLLFFLTNLHIEVLGALIDTYRVLPAGSALPSDLSLKKLGTTLTDAFLLAVQISAPFLVWSLLINLLFGLLNKLTPQVPVFFVSMPFVLAGGLAVAYFAVGELLRVFVNAFGLWLWRG